jgi:hypothetical protein
MWDKLGMIYVTYSVYFTTATLIVGVVCMILNKVYATQNIVYKDISLTVSKRMKLWQIQRTMVHYYPELKEAEFIRRRGRVEILLKEE